MTAQLFLVILTICSIVTSLLTEAIKKLVKKEVAANIVVLVVSAIVGGVGTAVYYILNAIPFNTTNIICLVLLILANFLVATVGYDKVKQAIEQIIACKSEDKENK